jgi:hypothetical protein
LLTHAAHDRFGVGEALGGDPVVEVPPHLIPLHVGGGQFGDHLDVGEPEAEDLGGDAVVDRYLAARIPHIPLPVDVEPGGDEADDYRGHDDRRPDRPPPPPEPSTGGGLLPRQDSRAHRGVIDAVLRLCSASPCYNSRLRDGSDRRTAPFCDEVHDDHGDVVVAARAVGGVDEPVTGRLWVHLALQDLLDPLATDHAGESIRTEEDAVPFLHVQRELIDGDVLVDPQSPRNDAALGMMGGFLLCEPPLSNHLLDERVVLGQLLECAVAEPVGAGISYVEHVGLPVPCQQGGDGSPHPPELAVGLSPFEDSLVRLLDLFDQALNLVVLGLPGRRLDGLEGE